MVARRAVAGLWLLILAVICTGSGAFQVLQAGRVPQSSLCSPPAAVCKSRPCIGSQASVYMSVPAGVDEDTSRHMAKKRLLKACEEFREAQLKLWASEALEEARLKEQGGKVADKDRLGGLFGGQIIELTYELLVSDTAVAMELLSTSLGVELDSFSVGTAQHEGDIRSASLWQARQPIHKKSVERWQLLRKELRPLLDTLAPILEGDTLLERHYVVDDR